MVRRVVSGTLALAMLSGIVAGVYTVVDSIVAPGHGHAAATRTSLSAQVPTTLPPPPEEPGGGFTLFPSHRLVAFYGAPHRPVLGVLGQEGPDDLWPQLAAAAAPFVSAGSVVVPTYELIAFVAQRSAGPDGRYTYQLPAAEVDAYLQVVKEHDGMLILDIQPGRSSLLADAQALQKWLVQPDVGLALDPEWELAPTQLPGRQIGQTTAAEIDQVSTWLEQLTVSHRLPQKLLMVHQFRPSMVPDKVAVTTEPDVAITFNMDGFGATTNKLSAYQMLAFDPRWYLGYKLFYHRDLPLQTPAEVLALIPSPEVIEYE
jgi:hypothetical protein